MLWTFNDFLDKRIKDSPHKIAIIYSGVHYSWKEFDMLSKKAAQFFLNRNVKPGCNVGIRAANSFEWLLAFSGLARIGAIPVLINVHFTENELRRIVEYADIKLMCCAMTVSEKLEVGADLLNFNDGFFADVQNTNVTSMVDELASKTKPDDTFALLFTSGTTSFSKGVMVTHNAMIKVAIDAAKIMHWDVNDVNCLALPLFHCFGLSTGFLASIACGSTLVMCKGSRTEEILGNILKYKCTILNGVPTMYFAIVRNLKAHPRKIATLKNGIIAGAAVAYEDYLMIRDVMGFDKLQMSYGQTECSPSVTFSDYDDPPELKAKSVGKVIPDVELKIISIADGIECSLGETGEICVKGYNVMKGYYKLPEETEKAIDKDGWLHTGDLGHLDEEGNLYFEGRIKELIIRGGENISPAEIESYIRKFPNVAQVKVIGIPAAIIQESVVACIIPEEGTTVKTEVLDGYLRANLARYKIPEKYVYLDSFPINASGKIVLNDLKQIVMNNQY